MELDINTVEAGNRIPIPGSRTTAAWCGLLIGLSLAGVSAAQVPVVPPPVQKGTWIFDEADAIPAYAEDQLQTLCDAIHEFQRAEMVILTLRNTGGQDPRKFAINWFNRKRIGDTVNNNGILIMCALEDRAIEIVLGDGLNTLANNLATQRIIDDHVIPRMKRNDVAGAFFNGAFRTARDVIGYSELAANIPESRPELETTNERRVRLSRNRSWTRLYFLGFGGALFGLFGSALALARWRVRYGKRKCDKCHRAMVMLDEQRDDSFLNPPEIIEEELGSVDYDVWACFECEDVIKYRYGALFTRYSRCPRCRFKTRSKVSRTLRKATRSRGGVIRVDEQCANCTYRNTYTYNTPKLPKPSSSSSSGGGGGFSGGGGGGGGGGFSSGGGGSGRW